MLSRYPHTATLEVVKENDPMSGITKTTSVSFEIKGRFQPAASKSNRIDYKAKYFCRNSRYLADLFKKEGIYPRGFPEIECGEDLEPFSVDGQKFTWEGKIFEVIMLHDYQTHCEIWLD